MPDAPVRSGPCAESRGRVVLVFLLMVVALYVAAGPLLRLSLWRVEPGHNHGLLEARAWCAGRLDLDATGPHPELGHGRPRDTAYRNGKIYNVFPPLFSFISFVVLKLQHLQRLTGADLMGFYAPWYVALVALPLPLVGFWAFRTVTGRSEWAAVMTAYWLLGTPMLHMLVNCRRGSINELNHVLSSVGLLLIAGDLLGRRRIWPAAVGLLIACWTRQLTFLYLGAMVWIVWRLVPRRRLALVTVLTAATVAAAAVGSLNWAKFGNPLDSGYASIYEGRSDIYAQRARQHGLFDLRWLPRNLWYMNVQPPEFRLPPMQIQLSGHGDGTSIWLTSPLLLFGLWDVRRWWRDPARRALMLASLAVIFGFLCYHNTGSVQRGFFRFALDFAPVWLMVFAPYLMHGRRRWIALACLAYSALYFHVLCGTGV